MYNLRSRTKRFTLDVISLSQAIPESPEHRGIRAQRLRSTTSAEANHRAACRARSRNDFVAKLALVEEEADESQFWLELLTELNVGVSSQVSRLKDEASQIVAIIVASKKTARNSS